jgi:hypothetical protein
MLKSIVKNLSNLPGWRTTKKIVVIESDDWGAVRMASSSALKEITKGGVKFYDADEERYLSNDSLESNSDLSNLFELLSSHKDFKQREIVFTAVAVVANPDFNKIKKNDFREYFYEPFTETLKQYPDHDKVHDLWKEGIAQRLFVPQFHGREHLNVHNWMRALKSGNEETMVAFNNKVYGITPTKPINHVSYQAAFDIDQPEEIDYQREIITEGLDLFEDLLGYRSTFFVPTNGPFNNKLQKTLSGSGIKYIGASKIQKQPIGKGKTKTAFHYLGQENQYGQTYLTRNAFFEPSSSIHKDWVNTCLCDIETAFRWNKPAIISSHRVNYIGGLNSKNRDKGLFELNRLLKQIFKVWPEVIFMTSAELGDMIKISK